VTLNIVIGINLVSYKTYNEKKNLFDSTMITDHKGMAYTFRQCNKGRVSCNPQTWGMLNPPKAKGTALQEKNKSENKILQSLNIFHLQEHNSNTKVRHTKVKIALLQNE